jgi:hypothetical protein
MRLQHFRRKYPSKDSAPLAGDSRTVGPNFQTDVAGESVEVDFERHRPTRIRAEGARVELIDFQPQLRDLSMFGAYVKDPRPLRVGRIVRVRIWLSEKEAITAKAIVRSHDEREGMGIEFLEISNPDRARLEAFMKAKHEQAIGNS